MNTIVLEAELDDLQMFGEVLVSYRGICKHKHSVHWKISHSRNLAQINSES